MDDQDLTLPNDPSQEATSEGEAGSQSVGDSTEGHSDLLAKLERANQQREGSRQEAMRLKHENDQMRQALLNYQQQLMSGQTAAQPPAEPGDINWRDFSDAAVAGDGQRLGETMTQFKERIKRELAEEGKARSEAAADIQATQAVFQRTAPILQQSTELQTKMWQRFQELQASPEARRFRPQPYNYPGVGTIDLNLLAQAADEVTRSVPKQQAAQRNAARDAAHVPLDSGGGDPMPTGQQTGKFNPMVHLSEEERATIDKQRQQFPERNYSWYFNALAPQVKQARLKQNRPVKPLEMGMKERVWKFDKNKRKGNAA